jgi:hypothetical protein
VTCHRFVTVRLWLLIPYFDPIRLKDPTPMPAFHICSRVSNFDEVRENAAKPGMKFETTGAL